MIIIKVVCFTEYCRLQVVQFLLGHVDKRGVYQALMLAINLGHDEIAEMIIEHPVYEDISAEIKASTKNTI